MKNPETLVYKVEIALSEDRRSYELLLSAVSAHQPELFAQEILDSRNSFLIMGLSAAISFQKMLEKQGVISMRRQVTQ